VARAQPGFGEAEETALFQQVHRAVAVQ
jgi:hypothetical protein